MIEKSCYYDPLIFSKEREIIFDSHWLFCGLTSEIPGRRDWKVIEYFGHSLILYNSGKSIRVFQNVCPHRFNKIFDDTRGRGVIVCGYHSWSFSEEGYLVGNQELEAENDKRPCLKEYPTEIIGQFIFVALKTPIQSIQKQLGKETVEILNTISLRLTKRIFEQSLDHCCNWKFIVENVIETEHCLSIHQDTLVKAGYCQNSPIISFDSSHDNSSFIVPFSNDNFGKKRNRFVSMLFGSENVNSNYQHHFIFPNLLISNFENINFNVSKLLPINAERTLFDMQFFIAPVITNNQGLIDEFISMTIQFGKEVFEEDKLFLERVQKGVKQIDHNGFHYKSATRIHKFVESYKKWMLNGKS